MQAFTNLLPLLLLLLGIFGVLITAALFLRALVRKNVGPSQVSVAGSPISMKSGDVAVVLGRTFQVRHAREVVLSAGPAFWFALEREDGQARLMIAKDLGYTYYLPNQGEFDEQDFPEVLTRKEGAFARQGLPIYLDENEKIALYAGPNDRWLAAESAENTKALWAGKSIPVEGITVLVEK